MYTFRPYSLRKYACVEGDLLGLPTLTYQLHPSAHNSKRNVLHDERHVPRLQEPLAPRAREAAQWVPAGRDVEQVDEVREEGEGEGEEEAEQRVVGDGGPLDLERAWGCGHGAWLGINLWRR